MLIGFNEKVLVASTENSRRLNPDGFEIAFSLGKEATGQGLRSIYKTVTAERDRENVSNREIFHEMSRDKFLGYPLINKSVLREREREREGESMSQMLS